MNPAMWISKTGVQAQDAKLQAIANNLANVNTVGFKRDRVVFEDLFYQVEQQPGTQRADNTLSPSGVQLGNGTHMVGTQKVFTTGSLQTTSREFDVGWSKPLTFAAGVEHRIDKYEIQAGDPASRYKEGSQSYPGFSLTDAGRHRRTNKAAYINFAGNPVKDLTVDLAGRYEHFSDFGAARPVDAAIGGGE